MIIAGYFYAGRFKHGRELHILSFVKVIFMRMWLSPFIVLRCEFIIHFKSVQLIHGNALGLYPGTVKTNHPAGKTGLESPDNLMTPSVK